MNGILSESLFEGVQDYLSAYFANNDISQSFALEFNDLAGGATSVDLVFSDGPLCGKSISYVDWRFRFEGTDLALLGESSLQAYDRPLHLLIEDGYALCAEALLKEDYEVFDVLVMARHRCWRYIQDKFIPKLIDNVSDGYLPALALEGGWVADIERSYDMHPLTGNGFYSNKLEIKEGYVVFFYNFPEPLAVGGALYGAVLLNKATSAIEYYTLELSRDDKWSIVSKSSTKRQNFAITESRDRSTFLNWVINRAK